MKKGSHFSLEQKAHVSMGTKRALSNPIIRQRKSIATKLAWENPQIRGRWEIKRKQRYANPEARKKTGEASKIAWDNPEVRAKHMVLRTSKEYREKFSGKNNPMYIDGRSFEPYCPKFTEKLKEEVRKAFNFKCGFCGKDQTDNVTKTGKAYKLAVHHKDEDKMQGCDKPWSLVPLCFKCHGKESPAFKRRGSS